MLLAVFHSVPACQGTWLRLLHRIINPLWLSVQRVRRARIDA